MRVRTLTRPRAHRPAHRPAHGSAPAALALLAVAALAAATPTVDDDTAGAAVAPGGSAARAPLTVHLGAAAPHGAPPATPYLVGRRLLVPDARPVRLATRYDDGAVLGGRLLGVRSGAHGSRVLDVVAAGTGRRLGHHRIRGDVALSPAGTTASWATPRGEVRTLWAGGGVSMGRPGGPVVVRAVLGDGSCYEVDGGCQVFVDTPGGPPRAADSHGIVDTFAPGAIDVSDVTERGLAAVLRRVTDRGSCSGAYDELRGRYLWRTCDHALLGFAPGGRRLLATGPAPDGAGPTTLSVLSSRTGRPLLDAVVRRGRIAETAWEDPTHVLAVVHTAGRGWRVLRVATDGNVQTALTGARGGSRPPYVLLQGR